MKMTLRHYFAGQSLMGLRSMIDHDRRVLLPAEAAKLAVQDADALLSELTISRGGQAPPAAKNGATKTVEDRRTDQTEGPAVLAGARGRNFRKGERV